MAKKLLIVGGGAVATEFYLPSLRACSHLFEITVIDTHASSIQKIKKEFPEVVAIQADFASFLKQDAIHQKFDATVISLPNSLHREAVIAALEAGTHVLCEKPLTAKSQDCLDLQNIAQKKKKHLVVGMTRRFTPSFLGLKMMLDKNTIGEVRQIEIEDGNPYGWISESGVMFKRENGGVLSDIGLHYLDLIYELFGEIEPVSYWDDDAGGVETNVKFELKALRANIPISLKLSWTRHLENQIIIHGSQGKLILQKNIFTSCFWQNSDMIRGEVKLENPFRFGEGDNNEYRTCFTEQFFRFHRLISGESEALPTGEDAAQMMKLIQWAYEKRASAHRVFSSATSDSAIAITGATGFIGSALVRRLYEKENVSEVRALVRSPRTAYDIVKYPIDMRQVSLLDQEAVYQAVKGVKAIYHLAYGRDGLDADKITVEGTRCVIEAGIRAQVDSIVVLSSMAVFGFPDQVTVADESLPYRPSFGMYGSQKVAMEKMCFQLAKNSGKTRIVILNPTCVYGPGGKTFVTLPLRLARKNQFCWIENGIGQANYIYIENLLDAMLLASRCEEAHGQRFIVNDGAVSWKQFLSGWLASEFSKIPVMTIKEIKAQHRRQQLSLGKVIKEVMQNPANRQIMLRNPLIAGLKQIAKSFSKQETLAMFYEDLKPSFDGENSFENTLPPLWLIDLFGPTKTAFCADKAKRVLGWAPKISLEEGQKLTQDWLNTHENVHHYPCLS